MAVGSEIRAPLDYLIDKLWESPWDLKGSVCVVIGAGSGMGEQTAKLLYGELKVNVVMVDNHKDRYVLVLIGLEGF